MATTTPTVNGNRHALNELETTVDQINDLEMAVSDLRRALDVLRQKRSRLMALLARIQDSES